MKSKHLVALSLPVLAVLGIATSQAEARPSSVVSGSCGLIGDVAQRVLDCSQERVSLDGYRWSLVTRVNAQEVWRDDVANTIWSAPVKYRIHAEAVRDCGWVETLAARGKISDQRWKLPSVADYRLADEHGLREILKTAAKSGRLLWTSTYRPRNDRWAVLFWGDDGSFGYDSLDKAYTVRCVAQL